MDFDPVIENLPRLLNGFVLTLELTAISLACGMILALPLALLRVSRNPVLWVPVYGYIFLFRGTPLLIQIYLIYYGLGQIDWIKTTFLWAFFQKAYWCALLAFSLNTAAYNAEILRGAIQAVPHGEIEAARAFGMNRRQVFFRVTLPRAVRICLPTMSSETILLLKATSLAYLVTVYEVMGTATSIRVDTFRVYDTLIAAGIVYFVMVFLLTRVLNWVERKLNKDRAAPVSSISSILSNVGPA